MQPRVFAMPYAVSIDFIRTWRVAMIRFYFRTRIEGEWEKWCKMHPLLPEGATVTCIKISVLCHQGTQILIQYLGLFFCIFLELRCKVQGIISYNSCLTGNNCRISFLWIKCSICFQTDSRQNRPLVYSRRSNWPQFCTPLGRNRGKRTQCYDIIRTRCTLFIWRDLA